MIKFLIAAALLSQQLQAQGLENSMTQGRVLAQEARLLVPRPTSAAETIAGDALIRFALANLPKHYYNLNKFDQESVLGNIFSKPSLFFERETPVSVFFADLNSDQTCRTKCGEIIALRFADEPTLKRLLPWIKIASAENYRGTNWGNSGSLLGYPWLASSGNTVVILYNNGLYESGRPDERNELIVMAHKLAAHFDLKESPNDCALKEETQIVRGPWVVGSNSTREIPLLIQKDIVVTGISLVGVANNSLRGKFHASLLAPNQKEPIARLPNGYDWSAEDWRYLAPEYLIPSRGTWLLQATNSSIVYPIIVAAWGVKVSGYSPESCQ